MTRVVPAEGVLLVAGSSGLERVPPRREGGSTDWHQPLHVRDRGAARRALRAQVEAGADVVVAPAYLTHRRALSPYGETRRAAEWTRGAVEVAREAVQEAMEMAGSASSRRVLVAGPMSPLLPGRFQPSLDPGVLAEEDRERADLLVEGGVDLLLPEQMPSLEEARSAAAAAVATGVPVWLGLQLAASGVHLPSGDALEAVWSEVAELPLDALLLTPASPEGSADVLEGSRRFAGVPLGVWLAGWRDGGSRSADGGRAQRKAVVHGPLERQDPAAAKPEPVAPGQATNESTAATPGGPTPPIDVGPGSLADLALRSMAGGARVVGLASGASPDRVRELRAAIDEQTAAARERLAAEERRWLDAVAHAAERAPGGRALWLGPSPAAFPAGFDWAATASDTVPALPERAFRLVIADPPDPADLASIIQAIDRGGYLLTRSPESIGAVPEGLELISTEGTPQGEVTLFRRPA